MPRYIRPKVTGATVFLTVALADRRSAMLVERIENLREAVRATRAERPSAPRAAAGRVGLDDASKHASYGLLISPPKHESHTVTTSREAASGATT